MQYIERIYRGRINRKNYALGLLFTMSSMALMFPLTIPMGLIVPQHYPYISAMIFALWFIAAIIHVFSLHVRRLHDLNASGNWLFFAIVPGAGPIMIIYLLLAKGKEGNNKCGEAPAKKDKFFDVFFGRELKRGTAIEG